MREDGTAKLPTVTLYSTAMKEHGKLLSEANGDEVREYLLRSHFYSTIGLPPYISFDAALSASYLFVEQCYNGQGISEIHNILTHATRESECNYEIIHNKDGMFAWRPFALIHPFIYASLVRLITDNTNWTIITGRIAEFGSHTSIECASMPVIPIRGATLTGAQISNWYTRFERRSVELSARYPFILKTDIANCYPSIYTHSISWALHGKDIAKKQKTKKDLLGNLIDLHLRAMNFGQTNGIRQGSVLMDVVAEIVLGYADLELGIRLAKKNIDEDCYHILRYRDDYHIFCSDKDTLGNIQLELVEVLRVLNFSLSVPKTIVSDNPIMVVVKEDKMAWLAKARGPRLSIVKSLQLLYQHASEYPNTGSVVRAMDDIDKRVRWRRNHGRWNNNDTDLMIAYAINIGVRNPSCLPKVASLISQLCDGVACNGDIENVISMMLEQFRRFPPNELANIWLQRIVVHTPEKYPQLKSSSLTELVANTVEGCHEGSKEEASRLWNCDWLDSGLGKRRPEFKQMIETYVDNLNIGMIDREWIDNHQGPIGRDEIRIFPEYYV